MSTGMAVSVGFGIGMLASGHLQVPWPTLEHLEPWADFHWWEIPLVPVGWWSVSSRTRQHSAQGQRFYSWLNRIQCIISYNVSTGCRCVTPKNSKDFKLSSVLCSNLCMSKTSDLQTLVLHECKFFVKLLSIQWSFLRWKKHFLC